MILISKIEFSYFFVGGRGREAHIWMVVMEVDVEVLEFLLLGFS